MDDTATRDTYLAVLAAAGQSLDELEQYGISTQGAHGLLVLHGLAMYARDTARASAALLLADETLAAGALTRIVLEHAVLAEWLTSSATTTHELDRRAHLFLRQAEVEQHRWYEVVRDAGIEPDEPPEKRKNVDPDFNTVKNLFGDTETGRQMYLTYRNLSRFVHPTATTFMRFTRQLPYGVGLIPKLQVGHDPEALAYYLASATVICALRYLESLGEESTVALTTHAQAAGLLISLAETSGGT